MRIAGSPRFHLLHHFQPLAFSLQPFFGRPHSPNNRSTRSHFGRRDGAPKCCGKLLQAKADSAWPGLSTFARAGFKCT